MHIYISVCDYENIHLWPIFPPHLFGKCWLALVDDWGCFPPLVIGPHRRNFSISHTHQPMGPEHLRNSPTFRIAVAPGRGLECQSERFDDFLVLAGQRISHGTVSETIELEKGRWCRSWVSKSVASIEKPIWSMAISGTEKNWRYLPYIRPIFQAYFSGDIPRKYGLKYGTNVPPF